MTRTADAILAAVIADPGADLPRLAYADWCEERGDDARAEFVRVQLELARLGDPDPPTCGGCYCEVRFDGHVTHRDCRGGRLRVREQELLLATRPGQWSGFPEALWETAAWDFRRGFVAEILLPCAAWMRHGPALVRAAPLERVTLAGREPVRGEWAAPGDDVWWWVRASRVNANRPEALPPPLFRALARLRREERRTGTGLGFGTPEAARGALSEAALAWARGAAVAAPPAAGV